MKTEDDFEQWLSEQRRKAPEPEVSEEFLTAQRRSIYSRMHQSSRNFAPLRWAVSIAMVLAVVAGLTLPRFHRATVTLTNDEQLYADLAAIEQTDEPKAIQPLHKLFEQ